MLGHIQGPWGTEVPMHRRLAVRLRVAAALLLDYCFAGPRDAAVSATLLLPLRFWRSLLRIPLVRWSLGFVPECLRVGFRFGWRLFLAWPASDPACLLLAWVCSLSVFRLGFGSGGGSFVVGRHTSFRCSATETGWCCQELECLVDVSKKNIYIYIFSLLPIAYLIRVALPCASPLLCLCPGDRPTPRSCRWLRLP